MYIYIRINTYIIIQIIFVFFRIFKQIGTLLHRCGFLINTPRSSNFYRIKYIELFKFRNMKLKQMDDLRVNKHNLTQSGEENPLNEEQNSDVILSAEGKSGFYY